MKATINLVLELRSPYHSSSTRSCEANMETLKVERRPPGVVVQVPTTGTQFMPVSLTADERATLGLESDWSHQEPIIPANSIRGRFRRVARDLVTEALKARGLKLSLQAMQGLSCGSGTGQGDKSITLAEADKGATHPFLGMFGGGPRWIRTAYTCPTSWPITDVTLTKGIVPEAYNAHKASGKGPLTIAVFFSKVDDIKRFAAPHLSEGIENYAKAVQGWLESVEENTAKRGRERAEKTRDDEKTKKAGIDSFLAHEVVLPGVRFFHRITVNATRTGAAGLGLLLRTIEATIARGGLGGWARNGYGELAAVETSICFGESSAPLFAAGMSGGPAELNLAVPEIAAAVNAWSAYAAEQLTATELEELFALPPAK